MTTGTGGTQVPPVKDTLACGWSHLKVSVWGRDRQAAGRAMSWSCAVPVFPVLSCRDMALRRVLALGAALGRRSCCSKVGPGLQRALRS